MMRAMVLAALLSACASTAQAPLDAALGPFLGCWRGAFANTTEVHDERCLARAEGGVRDTHFVRPTSYGGETLYSWDQRGGIAYTYRSNDGGVLSGAVVAEGRALVFPEADFVNADGSRERLRATWRIEDADRFVTVTERFEAGEWREFMRIVYTRSAAS